MSSAALVSSSSGCERGERGGGGGGGCELRPEVTDEARRGGSVSKAGGRGSEECAWICDRCEVVDGADVLPATDERRNEDGETADGEPDPSISVNALAALKSCVVGGKRACE